MAESEEELKSLLRVKEGSEKAGLKLNIKKTKIVALPTLSWALRSLRMVTAAVTSDDCFLAGKL